MRFIEFTFIIAVLICLFIPKKRVVITYWFLFGMHFFIDNLRWQLVPVYTVAILYTLLIFIGMDLKMKRFKIPAFCLLTLSTLIAFLTPVFFLPKPTGEYSVGTKMIYLTDNSRDEIFTEIEGDKRQVIAKVWYPCDNVYGTPEDYWEDSSIGKSVCSTLGVPGFLLDHISLVKSHSYVGATISKTKEKFPVVIFSHGLQSYIVQNRVLMEELASRGYIVFSIGHIYDAAAIINENGEVINFSETLLNEMIDHWKQNEELYKKEHTGENVKKIIKISTIDKRNIGIRAGDISFLLDNLPAYSKSQLNNKVDFNNIGIVGHSYGGATAVEVLIQDYRVKTGISMDGYPYGSLVFGGEIAKPFMFLNAEAAHEWSSVFKESFKNDFYTLIVKDTEHMDFTDTPIYSPIMSIIGFNGKNNGQRTLKIVNNHVIDFFDFYLKAMGDELFADSELEYPEVEYN